MKIKVISNGTPSGTKIVDVTTGEEITGSSDLIITKAYWEAIGGEGLCTLTMDFALVPVEIESNVNIGTVKCVHCGHKLKVPNLIKQITRSE